MATIISHISSALIHRDYASALNLYSKCLQSIINTVIINTDSDTKEIITDLINNGTNAHTIILYVMHYYRERSLRPYFVKDSIRSPKSLANEISDIKDCDKARDLSESVWIYLYPNFKPFLMKVIDASMYDLQFNSKNENCFKTWNLIYHNVIKNYSRNGNNAYYMDTIWFQELRLIFELYQFISNLFLLLSRDSDYKSAEMQKVLDEKGKEISRLEQQLRKKEEVIQRLYSEEEENLRQKISADYVSKTEVEALRTQREIDFANKLEEEKNKIVSQYKNELEVYKRGEVGYKTELDELRRSLEEREREIRRWNEESEKIRMEYDKMKMDCGHEFNRASVRVEQLTRDLALKIEGERELHQKIQSEISEKNTAVNNLIAVNAENENLREKLRSFENEMDRLSKLEINHKTTNQTLRKEIETLKREIDEKMEEIDEFNERRSKLTRANDNLEEKLRLTKREMKREADLALENENLLEKLRSIENKASNISAERDELSKLEANQKRQNIELKDENQRLRNEIEKLKLEIKIQKEEIDQKIEEIDDLNEKKAKYLLKNQNLSEKLLATEKQMSEKDIAISQLKVKSERASETREEKENLMSEIEILRSAYEKLRDNYNKLKLDNDRKEGEINNKTIEAKNLSENLYTLNDDLIKLQSSHKNLSHEYGLLQNDNDNKQHEIDEKTLEIDELSKSKANLLATMMNLSEQVQALTEMNQTLRVEVDALRERATEDENTLRDLMNDRCDDLKELIIKYVTTIKSQLENIATINVKIEKLEDHGDGDDIEREIKNRVMEIEEYIRNISLVIENNKEETSALKNKLSQFENIETDIKVKELNLKEMINMMKAIIKNKDTF